uniref:Uncharacterized protein n=1 Tax=Rhizophora mucronata TaxID=61149 RepID=A0A2P2P774_RHIMU
MSPGSKFPLIICRVLVLLDLYHL